MIYGGLTNKKGRFNVYFHGYIANHIQFGCLKMEDLPPNNYLPVAGTMMIHRWIRRFPIFAQTQIAIDRSMTFPQYVYIHVYTMV